MKVYYNEFDKKKCAALNALMQDGIIRLGDIDDRPIQEVKGYELREYERCHFFAGVGLWDMALDLAGWEEGCRVWTGSCPCQPFSTAGRQKGKTDDRHLWPFWLSLIQECCPPVIFGEQVNAAITHGWLDDVYQGLEENNYAVGSVTMPASAVGAPHRRERLWFVGDSRRIEQGSEKPRFNRERVNSNSQKLETEAWDRPSNTSTMGNAEHNGQLALPFSGSERQAVQHYTERKGGPGEFKGASSAESMANTDSKRPKREWQDRDTQGRKEPYIRPTGLCGGAGNWIEDGEWLLCPDGKQRLIEPTIPLLANGFPEKDGVIHCAGDAIVPQLAAEFIYAAIAACGEGEGE